MFLILFELRIKCQMKIQNEIIIINWYVDDHFFNVSALSFWIVKRNSWRLNCWREWWFKVWLTNRLTFLTRTSRTSSSEFLTRFSHWSRSWTNFCRCISNDFSLSRSFQNCLFDSCEFFWKWRLKSNRLSLTWCYRFQHNVKNS